MSYIIRNRDRNGNQRCYVSQAGSQHSYTRSVRAARKFSTREEAQAQCCGNEYPVRVDEVTR